MYPPELVKPMKEDLTNVGFNELTNSQEVDAMIQNTQGSLLVVVNSVCGCAAGNMRPGVKLSLNHSKKPGSLATVFAGVDSGFNHLIRPMFYGSQHSIENISNPKGKERFYTVVGYICETDTFAWDRVIPEIKEGDILFARSGATVGKTFQFKNRSVGTLCGEN